MTDRDPGSDARADRRPDPHGEVLLEAVLSPHRDRDAEGRLKPPPEWWDLAPEALEEVHRRAMEARWLEAHLDPRGRSGTVRAVMGRVRGG
ncbi:MAG: hypothetical protein WD960_08430 [Gemmatimonadota bacterium]